MSSPPEDDRLHSLFDDAVGDAEPVDALDTIRARTRRSAARRGWTWAAGGALVATAATLATVAMLGNDPAGTGGTPPIAGSPGVTLTAIVPPTTEPTGSATVAPPTGTPAEVYYLGDTPQGPRLFRELHLVSGGDYPGAGAMAAVELAVAEQPADPDYYSPWLGSTARVASLIRAEGTITVNLSADTTLVDRPEGMTPELADLAVQQVVHTVLAAVDAKPSVPVEILLNGVHVETVFGVPVAGGVVAADESMTISAVLVDTPAEGAEVSATFTVSGEAAAFEATVAWRLMDGDTVVTEGFATADECCRLAPYSFEVTAPEGSYLLVVGGEDASGGEGPEPTSDTRNVTVVR